MKNRNPLRTCRGMFRCHVIIVASTALTLVSNLRYALLLSDELTDLPTTPQANLRSTFITSNQKRCNQTTKAKIQNDLFVAQFHHPTGEWEPTKIISFLDDETLPTGSGSNAALDETFFNSSLPVPPPNHTVWERSLLAFMRIPKTASSKVQDVLNSIEEVPVLRCFRGPIDGGKSFFSSIERRYPIQVQLPDCFHHIYYELVTMWTTFMLYEFDVEQGELENYPPDYSRYTLQLFSIVRDPFDRLESQFYYMDNIWPEWNDFMLPEQVSLMEKGDLWGWMESLYKLGSNDSSLPYQMHYYDENLTDAIAMIRGPRPRVFTVIQDCFEASILLLQEQFPQFIPPNVAQHIRGDEQANSIKKMNPFLNATARAQLREQAKVWFSDDFLFYDEAVAQFRKRLLSSSINTPIVQECLGKLDSIKK